MLTFTLTGPILSQVFFKSSRWRGGGIDLPPGSLADDRRSCIEMLSVAFELDPVGLVLQGGFSVLLSRLVPSSVICNGGPTRDHRSVSRGDRVPPTLTDVAPGQGPVCSADRTKDYHRSEGEVRRDVEKLGVDI